MAYNFNAVNDSLQQKANIFAPQGAPGGEEEGSQQQNVFQTSAPVTGNSTAGASSSAAPQAANKPGSGSGGSYNPAAAQKVYDGMGTGNYKPATDKIQGAVAKSAQTLQDSANAYTAKADTTAQGYKIDDKTLAGAADGVDADYQSVSTRLSQAAPGQYEAFAGLKADEVPKAADAVSKPSLFGDVYRPTAGSDYTTGQNRLNSMNLRRSGEFRNVAQQLGGAQEKVLSDDAKMKDELTNTTREKLGTAYKTETDAAKTKLNDMGETIIKTAKDQEAADEMRRQGLDVGALSKAEFDKLKPGILEAMTKAGLNRSTGYLDDPANFADLGRFINVDKDVDYTDFIDQAGSEKYNRINGLLGNNKLITPTAKDDDYSTDSNGMRDYINSTVQGKRLADDQALSAQMQAIQDAVTARNAGFKENPYEDAQAYVRQRYLEQNEGQSEAEQRAEQETFRQLFNPETNFDSWYAKEGGLTNGRTSGNWLDSLSTQEAQQMSALAKQLGLDTQYTQGKLNNPGYDPDYFNKKFETNFDRINGEINGSTPMYENSGIERMKTYNPIVEEQEAKAKRERELAALKTIMKRR